MGNRDPSTCYSLLAPRIHLRRKPELKAGLDVPKWCLNSCASCTLPEKYLIVYVSYCFIYLIQETDEDRKKENAPIQWYAPQMSVVVPVPSGSRGEWSHGRWVWVGGWRKQSCYPELSPCLPYGARSPVSWAEPSLLSPRMCLSRMLESGIGSGHWI